MSGPVYLTPNRSGHGDPELGVVLEGEGLRVLLGGHIDSFHGGIRTTFEGLPDAPIESFSLTMFGGRRGVLINSADVCRTAPRATVKLIGQNAAGEVFHTPLEASCPKGAAARHKKKRHGRHHGRGGRR